MISISQLAASVLFKTLQESKVPPEQSLRLGREKEGFVLQLDSPVKRDRIIRYQGAIVLIVNRDLENELGDVRIDVEETTEGRDLVMRRCVNPKGIINRSRRVPRGGDKWSRRNVSSE